MKKTILFLAFIFGCSVSSIAKKMQEVANLKNESICKGVAIEQIPGKSPRAQTANGSTSVCHTSKMEKNTEEETQTFQNKNKKIPGYRSFTTLGLTIGTGDYGDEAIEILTSHGCQINPYFYLGAGLGLSYHTDWEMAFVPIFVNARANFTDTRIIPFLDFKVGYSPFDETGVYLSPSVGASFSLGQRSSLSFSLGYTYQEAKVDYSDYGGYLFGFSSLETKHISGIALRFGIEF